MKVLQIIGVNFKLGNGITAICDELIKTLIRNNVESEILLLKKTELEVPYKLHTEISDFRVFFDNNNFDLVVFHGLFYKEYIVIGKILMNKNIPYLIKPHSSLMKVSHKKSFLKKKIAFIFYLNRFIKNSSALLFSNEEEHRNSIFQTHKYFIDRNGVAIDPDIEFQTKSNTQINLLFLSRLDFKHKGIDYLIKGYKEYLIRSLPPHANLNIFGIGSDKELKRLTSMIKSIPTITFNGPVFGEDKEKVLQKSDILMLTSRYEGFPTIFIDVLTRGIPVIITPGTNAAYFQEEGVGWLAQLSASSIAKTIELAVKDYTQNRAEIAKKCTNFATNSFDIKKNIHQTIEIYRDILKQH